MFKVILKYAIADIDGTLYKVGTRISHSNEEELSEKLHHSSCEEASEAQKDWRQRFKLAQEYALAALADPEIRALYESMSKQQGKSARGMAVADYLDGNNLLEKK